MLTIERNLNIYAAGIPQIISLSQYDDDFQLVFTLYTSEGEFTIPSGTTAEVMGTKVDGNGYSASASISGSTVTVTGNKQMTACAGRNVYEIVLTNSGKRLATVNFILKVERAALDADTIQSETVLKELNAIIDSAATATEAAETATAAAESAAESARTLTIDPTLTQSGQAADAKATGDAIAELQDEVDSFEGISEDVKVALLNCFEHIAWDGTDGQQYYDALHEALYPTPEPEYDHTVWYKASDGVILSEFADMEVTGSGKGDLSETLTDNVLRVRETGSTNYVMVRLKSAEYVPANVSKIKVTARVKITDISYAGDVSGFYITVKSGDKAAGVFTRKTSASSAVWAIKTSDNQTENKTALIFGEWYDLVILNENGMQTVSVNGNVIYQGTGNTYANSSGVIFQKTTDGTLDMYIDYLKFEWVDA